MHMQRSGPAQYLSTQIASSSPLERVVLLYNGAIAAIRSARDAAARRDEAARRAGLSRALGIIAELQGSLDHDRGGDVAAQLDRLYRWSAARLADGALRPDTQPFDEVARVLDTLRQGWQEIAGAAVTSAP
jgi:flagellar protein FliS